MFVVVADEISLQVLTYYTKAHPYAGDLEPVMRKAEPTRLHLRVPNDVDPNFCKVILDKGDYKVVKNDDAIFQLKLQKIREERNQRLQESDWTQLNDVNLNETDRVSWATYRQSLRDLTESISTLSDVDNLQWPIKPE